MLRFVLLGVASFLSSSGCLTPERTRPPLEQVASVKPHHVRDIRVLLAGDASQARVRVDGPYRLITGSRLLEAGHRLPNTEVRVSSRGTIVMGQRDTGYPSVDMISQRGEDLYWSKESQGNWSPSRRVAGKLRLTAVPGGRVSVVNYLDLDAYVAGVLVGELYADFKQEAYNAAAIAGRTYALVEMGKKAGDAYDVTATEASQVYVGMPDGPGAATARRAVETTRGIVCTWPSPSGKRIFPTYYSSACGGMTQAAGNFKSNSNVPPLEGGVKCDYCKIAKGEAYRWKPRRMSKTDVFNAVVRRYPEFSSLGSLSRIDAVNLTPDGRLVRLRLVGANGATRAIQAEDFRLAVGSRTMRSTACRIMDSGSEVVFTDGKGFGHGVGLCQWGMEGQAIAGRNASQILKYYYPGTELVKAY